MIELMKELCARPGPSGCEDAVRAFVLKRVKSFADEIRTDAIGNVMVFRKGRKALDRPVAVCAHMDEVGVIIKKITEDGICLLYTSPSPRDPKTSRMPSSA